MSSLEQCTRPVIAAVHSACIGAGVSLITAADIRYCTEDAYFTVKEIDIGLAADVGALQRLPKIIGNQSLAREWCYTGRLFDSKEALSSGFVSRVSGRSLKDLTFARSFFFYFLGENPIIFFFWKGVANS